LDLTKDEGVFEFGGLHIDPSAERLTVNNQPVNLRPKIWALLNYMVVRPGVLLTKDELMVALWGDRIVTEASLNQAVRELRKTLGDDARSPKFIVTVHRRGFRFIGGIGEDDNSYQLQPDQSDVPSPGRTKLFGRQKELVRMGELLRQATNGQRQLCFVTGEPGIGKTIFVKTFLESIPAGEGITVPFIGRGQCVDQLGEGEAYLPILEALDRLIRGPGGELVQEQLKRYAPTWLMHLPWLMSAAASDYEPQLVMGNSTSMLREFCVFCEAIATTTPLILWLEDLHWSDHATIELLGALARRPEPSRILVLASYRPVEVALNDSRLRHLKQALVQQSSAIELPLEPLWPDMVSEYLADHFEGIDRLEELTDVIYETTDGNPLFVVTLANYLTARQILVREQNNWTVTETIESIRKQSLNSLRGIIELQLQQTTDEEQSLLESASILGATFSARAIANMLAQDPHAVEQACNKLAKSNHLLLLAGTVEWPDSRLSQRYEFIHDVFRRSLYDGLSPARLQQLHLRAGESLEEAYRGCRDEVAAELALHFELGRDPRRAIKYLQAAAIQIQQRGAAAEAALYLERALAQVASQPPTTENKECERDLRLNLMRWMFFTWSGLTAAKRGDNLQRALILCDELQDNYNKTPLLSLKFGSQTISGDINSAKQTRRQYWAAAENIDNPVLLSHEPLCSGLCDLISGRLHRAQEHFNRCVEMLRDEDLREPINTFGHDPAVASLGFSSIAVWLLGFPDEARRRARLAMTRSEAIGVPLGLVNALDMALSVEHFRDDLESSLPLVNALDECMARLDVEYTYSRQLAARNWILLRGGDASSAMAGMQRDIDRVSAAGHGIFYSLMYNTLAEACLATGAVEEGREAIEQAMQIAHKGERVLEAESWRLKGELLRAEGNNEQAEQSFRNALTVAGEQSALSLELRAANSLGRLNLDTGHAPDAAEYLAKTLERFTEGFDALDLREAGSILKNLA